MGLLGLLGQPCPFEGGAILVGGGFEQMDLFRIEQVTWVCRPESYDTDGTVRCQERKVQRGGAGQCLGAETGAFFVIEHPLGDTGFLGIDSKKSCWFRCSATRPRSSGRNTAT